MIGVSKILKTLLDFIYLISNKFDFITQVQIYCAGDFKRFFL